MVTACFNGGLEMIALGDVSGLWLYLILLCSNGNMRRRETFVFLWIVAMQCLLVRANQHHCMGTFCSNLSIYVVVPHLAILGLMLGMVYGWRDALTRVSKSFSGTVVILKLTKKELVKGRGHCYNAWNHLAITIWVEDFDTLWSTEVLNGRGIRAGLNAGSNICIVAENLNLSIFHFITYSSIEDLRNSDNWLGYG